MNNKNPSNRIILLDTLRGFLLILVILFHLCYDLDMIFDVRLEFMHHDGIYVFRDIFVSMLIFISGVCCNLSHSNIKRGLKTLICGITISLVTAIFMPDEFILFGILHFFGTSMIIYGLFQKIFEKIPQAAGIILSLLIFAMTFDIYSSNIIPTTAVIRDSIIKYPLFILGFNTGCSSADYYPLLPWFFMFLTGAIATRNIRNIKFPKHFYKNICPPLTWIGRNTLWIYMAHQPIMYGILYLFLLFYK